MGSTDMGFQSDGGISDDSLSKRGNFFTELPLENVW